MSVPEGPWWRGPSACGGHKQLIAQGSGAPNVKLKIVSELLGQSSVAITADLDSHVNEGMMLARGSQHGSGVGEMRWCEDADGDFTLETLKLASQ